MNSKGVVNIVVVSFGGYRAPATLQIIAQTAVHKGLAYRGRGFGTGTHALHPGVQFLRIAQKEGSPPLFSPEIHPGECDVLLGLEGGHAARTAAAYIGSHGTIIVNSWQYHPPYIPPSFTRYPTVDEVLELLRGLAAKVIAIDAVALSKEAGGDGKIMGDLEYVMLGALTGSGLLPFSAGDAEAVLAGLVSPLEQERVVRAYRQGVRAASGVS